MTLRQLREQYPNARIATFDKDGFTIYVSSMSYKVLKYDVKELNGITYIYAYID
jgi:hypothetical protein